MKTSIFSLTITFMFIRGGLDTGLSARFFRYKNVEVGTKKGAPKAKIFFNLKDS